MGLGLYIYSTAPAFLFPCAGFWSLRYSLPPANAEAMRPLLCISYSTDALVASVDAALCFVDGSHVDSVHRWLSRPRGPSLPASNHSLDDALSFLKEPDRGTSQAFL